MCERGAKKIEEERSQQVQWRLIGSHVELSEGNPWV